MLTMSPHITRHVVNRVMRAYENSQFAIRNPKFLTRSPHVNRIELERRTLRFALKIIEFVATLPNNKAGEVVEFQLVKAGTSVGAN